MKEKYDIYNFKNLNNFTLNKIHENSGGKSDKVLKNGHFKNVHFYFREQSFPK